MDLRQTHPGKYTVSDISLLIPDPTKPGEYIFEKNIRSGVNELIIYEDLYSNTVTGEVLILDGWNLPEGVPIRGHEFLRVVLKDEYPIERNEVIFIFSVVGLTDRVLANEREQHYSLKLYSTETVMNAQAKISRAYHDTVDNIVHSIWLDYLSFPSADPFHNPLIADPTVGKIKVVIPNWNPFRAINYLAQMALGHDTRRPGFLFFQTLDRNFHFQSYSELWRQAHPGATADVPKEFHYTHKPANIKKSSLATDEEIRSANNIIDSYVILPSFDTIRLLRTGALGSQLFSIDRTYKKIVKNDLDFFDYYKKGSTDHWRHLEQTIVDGRATALYDSSINESQHVAIRSNSSYIHDGVENYGIEQWWGQNLIEHGQFDALRLSFQTFGNTDLHVGMPVHLNIPSPQAQRHDKVLDEYLTGKWCVTAIKHVFAEDVHKMQVEVAKDSVKEPWVR